MKTKQKFSVFNCHIPISYGCVRNLGVYLDSNLSMETHVIKTIQACHYYLKAIGKIRNILDEDTTKLLMSSFILSRLDYCNALLVGSPKYLLDKLQKVQNKAARIVTKTKTDQHIIPILQSLHWLPLCFRIEYKILCFCYKTYYDIAPTYI